MFCRQIVADLRKAREADASAPQTVFVHLGSIAHGEAFFAARWPEAKAIANPSATLYDAFHIRRGRIGELLGPSAMLKGLGAALRGHGIGKPVGDPLRMPGTFLIHQDRIVWSHDARHAGDQPDLRAAHAVARALSAHQPEATA